VKIQAIAATVLLFASVLFGQDEAKTAYSPNNAFFAAVRSVPEASYIWKTDLDGFRLVILRCKSADELGDVYFKDDVSGSYVSKFQWSPDSKFVVLTTLSSGGHSPWHFTTFVFCVADRSLRRMDDLIGPITSPDFHFEPPSIVVVRVRDYTRKFGESADSQTVKVPLQQTYRKMHKLN
jgi:hypothetical protein